MKGHYNVLIVPEDGGQPKSLRISATWVKVLLWVAGFLLVALLVSVIGYANLIRKALDYDALAAEKNQLKEENRRIIALAQEVDQSRRLLGQIIRTLGGKLDLKDLGLSDSVRIPRDFSNLEPVIQTAGAQYGDGSFAADGLVSYALPSLTPALGFVSQGFKDDSMFPERSHRGIDIAGKAGTPVVAAADGTVMFSAWTTYFGNCIIVVHPRGFLTFYGHNQVNLKSPKQEVRRGEPIALLGNSGYSSAPHLHFEIWKDGVPVDPQEFTQ